ncbi:MAG: excinuclease ABC subunit UvrA [Parcubacteria group bacterium]|nr:excinuclease ABC subunit UvrA [Parcubacteria group bacterium]
MAKEENEEKIIIKGARTHNLKNIDVEMPRNKMVVFTGLSGSGKSSLAFDTIFAEGQRRYVESLSSYARQFLRKMQKPDVDEIQGLSPAISVDQKSASSNPRSTVATITEIYDYLRVLYARIGTPRCLLCDRPIKKLSNEEIKNLIVRDIAALKLQKLGAQVLGVQYDNLVVRIYAPLIVGRKGEYYQLLYDLLEKGYSRVRIDGALKKLRERIEISKTRKHDIDVLVDELYLSEFRDDAASAEMRLAEAIERALTESDGLVRVEIPKREAPDETETRLVSAKFMCPHDGFSYPEVEPRLFSFNSPYGACEECNGLGTKHFFGDEPCPLCEGTRLRKEARHVYLGGADGSRGTNIVELTRMTVEDASRFFKTISLSATEREVSSMVIREIADRLSFMENVGIEYLTLDRRAHTLSGGEAQRIRLASQLGSRLVGALYVLDEPTIGLHPADNKHLIATLHDLRNLGNTIIVVEHDEDTVLSSDYIVDIGPGAGIHGGKVIVSAPLEEALMHPKKYRSLTLEYLRGDKNIPLPKTRRTANKGMLQIRGGAVFNIQNLHVDVPLQRLVAVTGMSGSGKSSLLYEILHKNLRARFDRRYRSNETFNCASFAGTEYLSRAIMIDQSPIGRTPRSNPATYTGAFTHIRDLFAETEEARVRGWKAGRFSFNVPAAGGKGGRCETCQGNGVIAVEMHFLPTVYVTCDICGGKRFQKETLRVRYKGKNIHDVLSMTVEEGLRFFEDVPAVHDRLKTLDDVGLGYVELGQPATTLSGGESQRVKISSELYRPFSQKTIYLLDEPTVGLHYEDVRKLIDILQELVHRGNTVVVIEHNMDIIKNADYVIDMGPEGGVKGGRIVAKGTPEEVARSKNSHTAPYLAKALKKIS